METTACHDEVEHRSSTGQFKGDDTVGSSDETNACSCMNLIATVGYDHTIRIWDTDTRNVLSSFDVPTMSMLQWQWLSPSNQL